MTTVKPARTRPVKRPVEFEITLDVYERALDVAVEKGVVLAEIGRQILRNAYDPKYAFLLKHLTPPPQCGAETKAGGKCERYPERGTNRCRFHGARDTTEREDVPDRKTFRFGVLKAEYQQAKEAVGAAGQSVARWIEYNLERYGDPDNPGTI